MESKINIMLAIAAVIGPFITYAFTRMHENKKLIEQSPRDWHLSVFSFCKSEEFEEHEFLNCTPSIYEVILNGIDELELACKLDKISTFNDLHHDREYEFIFVLNNSSNSIIVSHLQKDRAELKVNMSLEPKKALLLALPSYGKPTNLIINYNGTYLHYNIKSSFGLLRPTKFS